MRIKSSRLRVAFFAVFALATGSTVLAWKPKTHVHLAEMAYNDAVDDGKVTIYAVDYLTGEVKKDAGGKVVIGTYRVNPPLLAAIKANPAHFRAGVLGPDAYPDIATGQQIIHPAGTKGNGETDADLNKNGPGTDPWLQHLWSKSYGANGTPDSTDACRAFVAGYMTHAAGDIYGHTLINHYTGDAFHFTPKQENAIKHIVLEGYIGKKTPAPTYDTRIDGGVDDFIYRNMVDAKPGTVLETTLLKGDNVKFSIPAICSDLRRGLQADIDKYNRDLKNANALEKIRIKASRGLQTEYKEHWVKDIDDGLKAWPALSHEVALALFFNPTDKTDLDKAKQLLDRYAKEHLFSMLGAPDAVGNLLILADKFIDALGIQFIKDAVKRLRNSLYDFVLESAFGLNTAQIKEYLGNPENQFDPVMTNNAFFTEGGTKITRADFDSKELRLSGATFDYEKVPAAYNTVVLTKLLMMEPAEVNRLMTDLGSNKKLGQPSAILGFAKTLDGSNQWSVNAEKMVAAEDVVAYKKIFMRQSGEKP